ncbi:MAG: hypothetical protein IIV45_07340 [Lachnospiraceae bacterium]|nr:hypothetical protein [Lachnospiraceae bacterium]
MKDLKKLTRMQGGYFVVAFLFVVAFGLCIFYGVQYGFLQMNSWFVVCLAVLLLVRSLFASGRENREFLATLPVKRKSWYVFDTVAGIVFVLAVYMVMFVAYISMMKLERIEIVSLGKLMAEGIGFNIVLYQILWFEGYITKCIFQWFGKRYLKHMEKGEEKRWAKP